MSGDNGDGNEKQYSNNELMAVLLGNQSTLATITENMATIQTNLAAVTVKQHETIKQVNGVDERLEKVECDVNTGDDCIKKKLDLSMKALHRTQISCVNTEYQSMLYNVIVYNMKETITTGTCEKQAD